MKNKGVQQSHASSQILEAIGMWKIARHPPNMHVVCAMIIPFRTP